VSEEELNQRINKRQNHIFQFLIAMVAACLVFAIMQGIRDNYGIMLKGIIEHTGISYASISFVIAVGQILYGATQPLFGILALRKSNAFVMFCGIILMASGLIVTPLCSSVWSLLIFFGIVLPSGTGALCFGIIMGAISPIIGEKRAAVASGIIQASAGIGDALMSPGLQYLISKHGIIVSMTTFSIPILLMIPVVIWLGYSGKRQKDFVSKQSEQDKERKNETLFTILRDAFGDSVYWCLLIGFSTCGFHMAIIETHLFSQYISSGIPETMASFALTVYGITTMLGAIATGFLGQKFKMKNVLAFVYGIRVLIASAFLIFPKSVLFAFIATGLLGLTGDSTVPPTTGIISNKVGISKMAIVYGSIFIGHQLGAFASAWLGGILVNTSMGYSALWLMDICLCLVAAIASFRIQSEV